MRLDRLAPRIVAWLALVSALLGCARKDDPARPVRVGSKAFTEGVILGDVVRDVCAIGWAGHAVAHERQLGGTAVVWKALLAGEIDVYVEYTGTLAGELLGGPGVELDARDLPLLRARLVALGIEMTDPLGFENTYALGVSTTKAPGLAKVSDLAAHPELAFGLSHEFLERKDGFPGLSAHYRLAPKSVAGMDHTLAYKALASGAIDVTDLYTTDAEIVTLGLTVLADDQRYFPSYAAVVLHRADLQRRAPGCVAALRALAGKVDAGAVRLMNKKVLVDRAREIDVAATFVREALRLEPQGAAKVAGDTRAVRILGRTREHLVLVLVSVLFAVWVGVPLGILAARRPRLRGALLSVAGALQTVPALALLVLLIPLLGIGTAPALCALSLYAILPVLEGTITGLTTIPAALRESAEALGLPRKTALRFVELPMASPSILSGVRIATVTSVGTATLGALVGAGGFGQPILQGIRIDHLPTILEGAVPAALLAWTLQILLSLAARRVLPRGL